MKRWILAVAAIAACGGGAASMAAQQGGDAMHDAGEWLADAGAAIMEAGGAVRDAGAREDARAQAQAAGLRADTYQVACGTDGYASQNLDGTSVIGASAFVCNSSGARECIGGTWVLTDTSLRVPCGQGKDLATITVFR